MILLSGEIPWPPFLPSADHSDIALLNTLTEITLFFGARPQIDERLTAAGLLLRFHHEMSYRRGRFCLRHRSGWTHPHLELEARLSLGLINLPGAWSGRLAFAAGTILLLAR